MDPDCLEALYDPENNVTLVRCPDDPEKWVETSLLKELKEKKSFASVTKQTTRRVFVSEGGESEERRFLLVSRGTRKIVSG